MYIKYRRTCLKETSEKMRHIKTTCSVIIVVTRRANTLVRIILGTLNLVYLEQHQWLQ